MSEMLLALAMICQAHPSSTGWTIDQNMLQSAQQKCVTRILKCIDWGIKGWEARVAGCIEEKK